MDQKKVSGAYYYKKDIAELQELLITAYDELAVANRLVETYASVIEAMTGAKAYQLPR